MTNVQNPEILRFSHKVSAVEDAGVSALIAGVFRGVKKAEGSLKTIEKLTGAPIQRLIDSEQITGTFKEFTTIPLADGMPFTTVLVMGLGKEKSYNTDAVRSITAKAVRTLRKIGKTQVAIVPSDLPGSVAENVEAITEGTILGLYKFEKYAKEGSETPKKQFREILFVHKTAEEMAEAEMASSKGIIYANATNLARSLGNEPGNICTPQYLAEKAVELGEKHNFTVKIHKKDDLKDMGMGGILSVGAAGKNKPVLIEMHYNCGNENAPHIGLVGKGITFDAGGISIKPGGGMYQMKFDMCGSAAVLGAMDGIGGAKPQVNITALIPSAENLLDKSGYKPGDVIKIYDGTTVEIINTDAEGRLLLADALSYITKEKKVDMVVDLATLTGGVIRAIGHVGSGIMGNNQLLIDRMIEESTTFAEKMWHFPLWSEFSVHLKSNVAEMTNCHDAPVASTPTAGKFLQSFVNDTPWIHLDIAGTAYIDEDTTLYYHKPYLPKRGATGVSVRPLISLVTDLGERYGSKRSEMLDILQKGGTESW